MGSMIDVPWIQHIDNLPIVDTRLDFKHRTNQVRQWSREVLEFHNLGAISLVAIAKVNSIDVAKVNQFDA